MGKHRNIACTRTIVFFLQRVAPNIGPLFHKLEELIFKYFFGKIFGEEFPPHS